MKALYGNLSTKPLSSAEANKLRPMLMTVFDSVFEMVDWFISHANREHAAALIWSDMDEDDTAILVDAWLAASQRSSRVAFATRGVVRSQHYLEIGKITGPRFLETFMFFARHGGVGW